MNTPLTEESLMEALTKLSKIDAKELKPTKIIMVPYPNETASQFQARVEASKRMMGKFK